MTGTRMCICRRKTGVQYGLTREKNGRITLFLTRRYLLFFVYIQWWWKSYNYYFTCTSFSNSSFPVFSTLRRSVLYLHRYRSRRRISRQRNRAASGVLRRVNSVCSTPMSTTNLFPYKSSLYKIRGNSEMNLQTRY